MSLSIDDVAALARTDGPLPPPLADADDLVVVVDDARQYVAANRVADEILAGKGRTLVGRCLDDICDPTLRDRIPEHFRGFLRDGQDAGTFTLRSHEGRPLPVWYESRAHVAPHRHASILRVRGPAYVLLAEPDDPGRQALQWVLDVAQIPWKAARTFDRMDPPAIALLDLALENRARLGESLNRAKVPFLVSSMKDDLWFAARALGASGYLRKPYDLETLVRLLLARAPALTPPSD